MRGVERGDRLCVTAVLPQTLRSPSFSSPPLSPPFPIYPPVIPRVDPYLSRGAMVEMGSMQREAKAWALCGFKLGSDGRRLHRGQDEGKCSKREVTRWVVCGFGLGSDGRWARMVVHQDGIVSANTRGDV